MGIDQHRTDQVYLVIESLVSAGQAEFRPGHIADALRDAGSPILTWEIRMELARLEAEGLVQVDETSGAYTLAKPASRKTG